MLTTRAGRARRPGDLPWLLTPPSSAYGPSDHAEAFLHANFPCLQHASADLGLPSRKVTSHVRCHGSERVRGRLDDLFASSRGQIASGLTKAYQALAVGPFRRSIQGEGHGVFGDVSPRGHDVVSRSGCDRSVDAPVSHAEVFQMRIAVAHGAI